ncbi:MAG TPA: response regulator transcription factor, partial [Thermomicrobiales bacterium]|nr:response regulator transcription factor [Thermomicrobiales bacterium]
MTTSPAQAAGRILVVDDEPQIRRALKTTLTAHGFEVETAEDGDDALVRIATWTPDAIVLDLVMPGKDGFEVLRDTRTWSQVPVIVLSARGQESDKVHALDMGADDYLTKPFGIQELLARLRAVMRRAAPPT